jgi:hypothetical protein
MLARIFSKFRRIFISEGPLSLVYVITKFLDRRIRPYKYFHFPEINRGSKYLLFISGEPKNSTSFYRCEIPKEQLESIGLKADIIYKDFVTKEMVKEYEHVVWYRVPLNEKVREITSYLKQNGREIIYSIDDLLFDLDSVRSQPWLADLYPQDRVKFLVECEGMRDFLEIADRGIGSTEFLSKKMRAIIKGEVYTLQNCYSREQITLSQKLSEYKQKNTIRIGFFSGSETHDSNFSLIEKPLIRILDEQEDVELLIGGRIRIPASLESLSKRIVRIKFKDFISYIKDFSRIDIVLVPLIKDEHNEAKSEIRGIQAGLMKRIVVATNTQAYRDLIDHKNNGFLVSNKSEWYSMIISAIKESRDNKEMGQRLYGDIIKKYNPEIAAVNFTKFLDKND